MSQTGFVRYWFVANSTGIKDSKCCMNCIKRTTRVDGLDIGMFYCSQHDVQVNPDHVCPKHKPE